jgi:hypothetical protein
VLFGTCTGSDLSIGLKQGALLGIAVLALTLPPAGSGTHLTTAPRVTVAAAHAAPRVAEFGDHLATAQARFLADWVSDSRDNHGQPFVILDKRDARLFVFDAVGHIIDATPVLLGAAAGDGSVADIGRRPMSQVRPEERTTPAGRFISQPGKNASGEDVIWVDYDNAVSMHRVRLVDPAERRLERLASPDPAQRRISYGCINVPTAFYDAVLRPHLGSAPAVVYVLPETRELRAVFATAYPVAASNSDQGLARGAGL